MKKCARLTLVAILALCGGMTKAAFCQDANFEMEEADCKSDAMQFCGPEIPDHAKILSCLQYYHAEISPACRSLVMPSKKE